VRFCPGRRPSSATNNAGRSGSAAELFPVPAAASSAAFVRDVLTKLTRLVTSTEPKDSLVVVGMRGVVVVDVVVVVVVVVVACENM